MRQKAAQQLTYKSHVTVRLKSGKRCLVELEQWEWLPQNLMILGYILGFVTLRNHYYCHPNPPHTPVLTVSAIVLWLLYSWPSFNIHQLPLRQKGRQVYAVVIAVAVVAAPGPGPSFKFALGLNLPLALALAVVKDACDEVALVRAVAPGWNPSFAVVFTVVRSMWNATVHLQLWGQRISLLQLSRKTATVLATTCSCNCAYNCAPWFQMRARRDSVGPNVKPDIEDLTDRFSGMRNLSQVWGEVCAVRSS